jgi:hypothetical protein
VTCDIGAPLRSPVLLGELYRELDSAGLVSEVAVAMTAYLSSEEVKAIHVLMPFFVLFMNTASDPCKIVTVGWKIFSLSNKLDVLSVLERFFWVDITSTTALECLVPLIIGSGMSPLIIRRTLHALRTQNSSWLGSLVVCRCLDSSLRRRSFSDTLTAEKVFSAIPTLPFNCPAFTAADFPRLLFCAVAGTVNSPQEIVNNARLFLESSLDTLNRRDAGMLKARARFAKVVEKVKLMDSIALFDSALRLASAVSEAVQGDFVRLISEPLPGESVEMWYIKAAASVHFQGGSCELGLKYVENLPTILRSGSVPQKLSLAFTSLTTMIPQFPEGSVVPVVLLWPAVLSVRHSNHSLRNAAMRFLAKEIPSALDRGSFKNINGLAKTMLVSKAVADAVGAFEQSINVSFQGNFVYALDVALTRGFEDMETRRSAVDCLKVCIASLLANKWLVVYFCLPFVAFVGEDPQWIVESAHAGCGSIQEFIFDRFEERADDERAAVIEYLADKFGERHCAHRLELLADCLLYGAANYGCYFGEVKKIVLAKCWKVLQSQQKPSVLDRVSRLCAAFLLVQWPKCDNTQLRYSGQMPDDVLSEYIAETIDGIAELIKSGQTTCSFQS